MKHVWWIIDGKLAGRPGFVRQPCCDIDQLHKGGFRSILSLDRKEVGNVSFIMAKGFRHRLVELPDTTPPLDADRKVFMDCLIGAQAFISEEIANKRSVLVHCAAGLDRTGMVLAYYLCRTYRLTPELALARIKCIRPDAFNPKRARGWKEMALSVMSELLRKDTFYMQKHK